MTRFVAPVPRTAITPLEAPPTFAVIIAAYQAASVIGDAITSVLAQDPPPAEIIVCDDGSTDDLRSALRPFDPHVTYLRIEHGGEAAAKNAAARAATSEFVAVLDADDVYLPGRLAAFRSLAMERPDLDILTTDAFLDIAGETIGTAYHDKNPFVRDDQEIEIVGRNFVFGLVAVRRSALLQIGGFDERIRYTTDWDCWVRMILDGSRVGLVDEPLARYRLNESSLSAQRRKMSEGRSMTLEKVLARTDLTSRQRARATEAARVEERRLAREELHDALAGEGPVSEVRSCAARVLRNPTEPWQMRAKALATFVLPRVARTRAQRRERHVWRTVGDRTVTRKAASDG